LIKIAHKWWINFSIELNLIMLSYFAKPPILFWFQKSKYCTTYNLPRTMVYKNCSFWIYASQWLMIILSTQNSFVSKDKPYLWTYYSIKLSPFTAHIRMKSLKSINNRLRIFRIIQVKISKVIKGSIETGKSCRGR